MSHLLDNVRTWDRSALKSHPENILRLFHTDLGECFSLYWLVMITFIQCFFHDIFPIGPADTLYIQLANHDIWNSLPWTVTSEFFSNCLKQANMLLTIIFHVNINIQKAHLCISNSTIACVIYSSLDAQKYLQTKTMFTVHY